MTRAAAPFLVLLLVGCASSHPIEGNGADSSVSAAYPPPVRAVPVLAGPPPASRERQAAGGVIEYEGAYNKCAACHALTPGLHGIGPSLSGAFGRPAASAANYRYSAELEGSGLVWDAATLDAFLENPRAMVPGTRMAFSGLKDPAQRAQVIAYMERYAD